MSGLVAVQPLARHASLSRAAAQRLMATIAHRGPHGRTILTDNGVSLGHAHLDSTGDPAGPWRQRADGPVLTGDLCLSNAASLLQSHEPPTDAAAILAAYDRWGVDLLSHLEGAFAFVLWDPRTKRLLAARDRFGIKPLYLRKLPDILMLCSEPSGLGLAHGRSPDPNEQWIADFLSGYDTSASMTADLGIERLPPGHLLLSEAGRVVIRRWWSLQPVSVGDTFDDSFAPLLEQACKDGLRGGNTAAMLSGGLDSSSICALAQRHSPQPLPTVSLRFPDTPDLDEGAYIGAVLAEGSYRPIDIDADADAILQNLDAVLAEQQHPFAGLGLGTTRLLYRAAARQGLTAILDGHGGDEVVSQGFGLLTELAAQGRAVTLAVTSRRLGQFLHSPWLPLALSPMAQVGPRPWGGLARRMQRLLDGPATPSQWRGLVHPELAARTNLVARVHQAEADKAAAAGLDNTSWHIAQHIALAANPGTFAAFEVLDRAAARAGIEPRYPFYDRRLVEWCVSQPAERKLAHGRPRALLRDGMQGILPDKVRLRSDKVNFLPNIWAGLSQDPAGIIARFAQSPPERLSPFINMDALKRAAQTLLQSRQPTDIQPVLWVWRAIWLDQWLAARDRHQSETIAADTDLGKASHHSRQPAEGMT